MVAIVSRMALPPTTSTRAGSTAASASRTFSGSLPAQSTCTAAPGAKSSVKLCPLMDAPLASAHQDVLISWSMALSAE